MKKKNNLLLSSLVTFSIFTAGCSDSDNRTVPPTPEPPVDKTVTATFNVSLTGMAVKGTMANASVSVHQINATTGEMSPVSFRLASSTEAESYTVSVPAGTSDEQVNEIVATKVLAENPSHASTDENGHMNLYLENNFSGAVVIKVTTSASIDSNWVRCDSYDGCGMYDDIASTVLPNDGDLEVEFGEWYKEDLTLSTIKYIPATETPAEARSYTANVTVFTEVVAKILNDNLTADPMVPISQQAISDASTTTVMQLLGADGVLENASLLSDISTGLGFDLSDVGADVSLNTGNTALAQLAASLQTIAADGENGTLAEIIASLSASISDGSLNAAEEAPASSSAKELISKISQANQSSKASGLFKAIQKRVKRIAAIYVAIITGDTAALDELGVNNGIRTSINKAIERAIESGATTQQGLVNSAVEIVALVEEIGCSGDECTVGDDLYADLAAKVSSELTMLEANVASISTEIDTAAAAITAASALAADVTDVDTAITYYKSALAAYLMVFDNEDMNVLGHKANRYDMDASAWVETARFLVSSSSEYQSILDSAEEIATAAHMEAMQVYGSAGIHLDAQTLFADAQAKLTEFNAVVAAAKSIAESSNDMALAKQGMTTTAQTTATSSYEAAMAMNDPQSVEAAAEYVMAAEKALADKMSFISMADAFKTYAEMALVDAQAYADAAEDDADVAAAATLVESGTALVMSADELIELAKANLVMFKDMVDDAKAKQVIIDKLPMVKAATQSFADINIVTSSGPDALGDIGEIMIDVLEEANNEPGDVTDKESALHTGWMYSFNETNMTIEASHETKGSFQGVAELANDGSETTLMFAWGATLNEAGEGGATFEFSSGDLDDCDSGTVGGSCSTLTFKGVFASLDDLENQEPVSFVSSSSLAIMDGDADFTGTLMLSTHDLSTTEAPDVYEAKVVIGGVSGDVSFNLAISLDIMDEEELLDVTLMIGDDGYMMKGSADNDSDLMGSIWLDDYNYGDFAEMQNGIVVTYIDGDEVEFIDLSFTIDD